MLRAVLGFRLLTLSFSASLLGSALAATAVHAQDGSRDEEARALFDAGRVAYRDGRFQDARDYFQRAYDLSHRSELLYNIASADDRLRHDEEALAGFEAFLAAMPDAENRAEVEARIVALRTAIAERAPATEEEPTLPVPTAPSGSGPTILFTWITAGAALATGALAVGFWVAANDQYGSLERGCLALRGGCTAEEISASGVETYVTLTNVFLVSSLVLAAATAVVLPLELTSGSSSAEPSPTVAVRVGPASLSLEGAF